MDQTLLLVFMITLMKVIVAEVTQSENSILPSLNTMPPSVTSMWSSSTSIQTSLTSVPSSFTSRQGHSSETIATLRQEQSIQTSTAPIQVRSTVQQASVASVQTGVTSDIISTTSVSEEAYHTLTPLSQSPSSVIMTTPPVQTDTTERADTTSLRSVNSTNQDTAVLTSIPATQFPIGESSSEDMQTTGSYVSVSATTVSPSLIPPISTSISSEISGSTTINTSFMSAQIVPSSNVSYMASTSFAHASSEERVPPLLTSPSTRMTSVSVYSTVLETATVRASESRIPINSSTLSSSNQSMTTSTSLSYSQSTAVSSGIPLSVSHSGSQTTVTEREMTTIVTSSLTSPSMAVMPSPSQSSTMASASSSSVASTEVSSRPLPDSSVSRVTSETLTSTIHATATPVNASVSSMDTPSAILTRHPEVITSSPSIVMDHTLSSYTSATPTLMSTSHLSEIEKSTLLPSFGSSASSVTLQGMPTSTMSEVQDSVSLSDIEGTRIASSTTDILASTQSVVDVTSSSSGIVTPSVIYNTSLPVTPSSMIEIRLMIVFEGDCDRLKGNRVLQVEFWTAVTNMIEKMADLEVQKDSIVPEEFTCDPLNLVFQIRCDIDNGLLGILNSSISSSAFEVVILDEMTRLSYSAVSVKKLPLEKGTNNIAASGLEQMDIVIIILAGFLFVSFIMAAAIFCCRECYRKQRASSFNLLDVPHADLKLSDFTLTRIPRNRMMFNENGGQRLSVEATQNGNSSQRKTAVKMISVNTGYDISRQINAENIRVRMKPHADGLVVGITCTASSSPTHDSASVSSSPSSGYSDPAKETLLKGNNSSGGTSNPNFIREDEKTANNTRRLIQEDAVEHMV